MRWVGHVLTVVGGVLILAPVIVAAARVTVGVGPVVLLDRAPTVILSGLVCFVTGVALRELG